MAKTKKIFQNINLNKNALILAKLIIANRASIANDDIIDKQYVDDSLQYTSALLLDANVDLNSIEGIQSKAQLTNKSINEILDELFFPVINHDYIKPTIQTDVSIVDTLTLADLTSTILEVGRSIYFSSANTVNYGSSAGAIDVDPYQYYIETFEGPESTEYTAATTFDTTPFTASSQNILRLQLNYKDAIDAGNSHGATDTTGTVENPYFLAGQLEETIIVEGKWAKYLSIFPTTTATPDALTLLSTLQSVDNVKILEDAESSWNASYDFLNTSGTQTIMIAVPIDAGDNPSIDITRNQEDISSLFTFSDIINVADPYTAGYTKTYRVFVGELPLPLTKAFTIQLNIN